MASNIQRGPRRMDAGDWVRLKRLGGAKYYLTEQPQDVINPPPRLETETGRRVFTEFGTSKTRRPASNWIDFVASQTVDYVLESQAGTCDPSKQLTINKICSCDTRDAVKHNGLCITCIYDPIVVRPVPPPVPPPVLYTLTIPDDICINYPSLPVVAGRTYIVTNNSNLTTFYVYGSGPAQEINIPAGPSTTSLVDITLTGLFSCPV